MTRVVDLCAAPGSWSQVLSRVLIKGEKFGRAAWVDQEAQFRQQWMNVFPSHFDKAEKPIPVEESAKEVRKPRKDVKIVSIDLQPISPLPGIATLQADITHPATVPLLLKTLDPDYDPISDNKKALHPVDLVLSDGAPDVTGLHDLDIYVQSQLLFAALNLALCVLKPGGKFVAKIFRGKNVDILYAQLKIFFERVVVSKPRSSRASSVEAFIVCINFQPPEGFQASLEKPLVVEHQMTSTTEKEKMQLPNSVQMKMKDLSTDARNDMNAKCSLQEEGEDGITEIDYEKQSEQKTNVRWIAPFIACGDLSAFDSDASYTLPDNHVALDPVQPPTAPPYKRALEMRKAIGGALRKTGPKGEY